MYSISKEKTNGTVLVHMHFRLVLFTQIIAATNSTPIGGKCLKAFFFWEKDLGWTLSNWSNMWKAYTEEALQTLGTLLTVYFFKTSL